MPNGNYVVASPAWNGNIGAATWGDGTHGITGPVSTINSVVGTDPGDQVGIDVSPVINGNYVVVSPFWKNGTGAVTWRNGATTGPGVVSAANSLVGSTTGDMVGYSSLYGTYVYPLADGYYEVWSPDWQNTGAVTVANGASALYGTIQPWNSVIGTAPGGGSDMSFRFDPMRDGLVVGRPDDNIVSVFTNDLVFENDFEQ